MFCVYLSKWVRQREKMDLLKTEYNAVTFCFTEADFEPNNHLQSTSNIGKSCAWKKFRIVVEIVTVAWAQITFNQWDPQIWSRRPGKAEKRLLFASFPIINVILCFFSIVCLTKWVTIIVKKLRTNLEERSASWLQSILEATLQCARSW